MPRTESYNIVLADDHALIRQGLKKIMEGVAELKIVGEAGDGLELLSLLNKVAPHMVILDISMPNLRGLEVISEMKRRRPDVKILVLSMHKEYLYEALSAGADGYLLKEAADREIFSAIEIIRQGKTYVCPFLAEKLVKNKVLSSERLSVREREVLRLIAKGKSSKEIADILSISVRTVESHRARLMEKLGLKNIADLVRHALQEGYI